MLLADEGGGGGGGAGAGGGGAGAGDGGGAGAGGGGTGAGGGAPGASSELPPQAASRLPRLDASATPPAPDSFRKSRRSMSLLISAPLMAPHMDGLFATSADVRGCAMRRPSPD